MKRDNSNLSLHRSFTALLVASLLITCLGLVVRARPVSASLAAPLQQVTPNPSLDQEPTNDTFNSAPALPASNTTLTLAKIDSSNVITGNDVDFWQIQIPANNILRASVVGSIATQITVLETENGTPLVTSTSLAQYTFETPLGVNARTVRLKVDNRQAGLPSGTYAITYQLVTPTSTAATSTPVVPTSLLPDVFEPNNLPTDVINRPGNPVSYLLVGSTFQSTQLPNFIITPTNSIGNIQGAVRDAGDVDWFFFFGRAGSRYRIDATVSPGTDTEIFIFRDDAALTMADNRSRNGLITENDDFQSANRSSRVEFTGEYTGRYWIKVWNNDPVPRVGAIALAGYNIGITELAGAGTSTPAPATPFPQNIDQYEYNGDFESAALIAPNVKYSNLNFVPFRPPTRDTVDNDFFRMPVKQGVYYTCETLDLGAGTDTNLIVFNQNAPQNRDVNAIGGNDNISTAELQRGNFASRVIFLAPYTGIVYLLVGDVTPPRAEEAQTRTYALQCTIGIPNTPTPTVDPRGTSTPAPIIVTATEEPPEPTFTPFPTPRPATRLIARPIDAVNARPTSAPSPTPRAITLDVQVFNDLNRNGLLDAGEGIANASVRLTDEPSSTPLSQAYTDGDGRVRFAVTNNTPVKVSIPLFGYSTVVDASTAVVRVALVPNIDYPVRLP
jgi:hypothetical protein